MKQWQLLVLLFGIMSSLLVGVFSLSSYDLFQSQRSWLPELTAGNADAVSVSGLYAVRSEEILSLLQESRLYDATNLYETEWEQRLEAHPWIEEAEVSLSYVPFEARIAITEVVPWVVVEGTDDSWVFSTKQNLIGSVRSIENGERALLVSELPRVETRLAGVTALEEALRDVRAIDLAGGLPFAVARYHISTETLLVEPMLRGSFPQLYFRREQRRQLQSRLQHLVKVLADLSSRGEVADTIDFRPKGQAVVTLVNVETEDVSP